MEPDVIGGALGAVLSSLIGAIEPGTTNLEINAAAPEDHRPLRLSGQGRVIDVHPGQLIDVSIETGVTGLPAMNLVFDEEVADWLAGTTEIGVGQTMDMAVCGEVLFSPVVREPILGGRLQMSGVFTEDQLLPAMAIIAGHFDCEGFVLDVSQSRPDVEDVNPRRGATRP